MITAIRSIIDVTLWEQPAGTQPLGPAMPLSWHRLELLLRGRAWCRDAGREIECTAGDLIWDGPGEHTLHRCGPEGFTAFLVTVEVAPGCGRDGLRVARWGTPAAARNVSVDLLKAWSATTPSRFDTGVATFTRLRFDALRAAGASNLPSPLRQVLRRIETDATSALGVAQLARVAGLSPSRLHALFATHLGTTPHRRLQEERLARAKARLTSSADHLATVATACGFADAATLCRVFRRELGVSPGEYRALNRQG